MPTRMLTTTPDFEIGLGKLALNEEPVQERYEGSWIVRVEKILFPFRFCLMSDIRTTQVLVSLYLADRSL